MFATLTMWRSKRVVSDRLQFSLSSVRRLAASLGLRREQYLPLVVPMEGIVNEDWIKIFLEVYQKCGLDITRRPLGPLLPAPKMTGQFCARPLTTSEAAVWLRASLEGTSDAHSFRSHSLKATLLSWSARAGFDKETRAVLGHHCSALQGSDIVYSLAMLLRRVRVGLDIEDDQMKEMGIIQTPAPFTPAAKTPGLAMPCAPALVVVDSTKTKNPNADALESAIETAQDLEDQSVKEELLTVEDIEQQAAIMCRCFLWTRRS